RQARARSAPRHGVPLVAHAAGVEPEGKLVGGRLAQRWRLGCDEVPFAVGREEAAVGKEPALAPARVRAYRPLGRLEAVELGSGNVREAAEVEIAPALVLEAGQRRVLAKHVGGGAIREGGAEPQAARNPGDDPPVGPRLARQRQEGALAR